MSTLINNSPGWTVVVMFSTAPPTTTGATSTAKAIGNDAEPVKPERSGVKVAVSAGVPTGNVLVISLA
ncbi:hypothetical protein [Actinokineospora globicatena]|uniref:hypothetical protein n=1 Tax=Actinokineospora globicatena TaxID=103729 RepID=UPI0020A2CAE5|nr:hypothetical protein [Actinokineospora globicatena]